MTVNTHALIYSNVLSKLKTIECAIHTNVEMYHRQV